MKIEIEIPKAFEKHFNQDKFKDSFERIMADITNKNELKRRIELFLDELDYSINEDFCKETMKMMREFIGHSSHRLDCEESRVKSLKKKLKEYKDLEEQGLLLRLPCKVGDTVYHVVQERIVEVSNVDLFFLLLSVAENRFNNSVFLTQAEAEQKLKELKEMKTHNGITE